MSKVVCQTCGGEMQATLRQPTHLTADVDSGVLHPADVERLSECDPSEVEIHVYCENDHEWPETGWKAEWEETTCGRPWRLIPSEQHSGLTTSPGYEHAAGYPD